MDLAEDEFGMTVSQFSKYLHEQYGVENVAGAIEKINSGHLDSKDILNYYNEHAKDFKPGSPELKRLHQKIESLIQKLHNNEVVTEEDLKSSGARPTPAKNVEYVKDYRRMIQTTQLDKAIGRVIYLFDQRLKSEKDQAKIAEIRRFYFDMKNRISELKSVMDEQKDISGTISDINAILENAADFIKK